MSDKYLVTSMALPRSVCETMTHFIDSALENETKTAQFVKFGDRWGYVPGEQDGEDWGVVVALARVMGHDETDILAWLEPVGRRFGGAKFHCVMIL